MFRLQIIIPQKNKYHIIKLILIAIRNNNSIKLLPMTISMSTEYTRALFFKKLLNYSADIAAVHQILAYLEKQYNNENRYYTLTHVAHQLKLLEQYHYLIKNEEIVFFAIWFRHISDDSWRTNNEERSAYVARLKLTEAHVPNAIIQKVVAYISGCKNYSTPLDDDEGIFQDLNLAVFGMDSSVYEIYSDQIRKEWRRLPSFILNRRRKDFLHLLLERDNIYNTEKFQATYELQARRNIKFELDSY